MIKMINTNKGYLKSVEIDVYQFQLSESHIITKDSNKLYNFEYDNIRFFAPINKDIEDNILKLSMDEKFILMYYSNGYVNYYVPANKKEQTVVNDTITEKINDENNYDDNYKQLTLDDITIESEINKLKKPKVFKINFKLNKINKIHCKKLKRNLKKFRTLNMINGYSKTSKIRNYPNKRKYYGRTKLDRSNHILEIVPRFIELNMDIKMQAKKVTYPIGLAKINNIYRLYIKIVNNLYKTDITFKDIQDLQDKYPGLCKQTATQTAPYLTIFIPNEFRTKLINNKILHIDEDILHFKERIEKIKEIYPEGNSRDENIKLFEDCIKDLNDEKINVQRPTVSTTASIDTRKLNDLMIELSK